MAELTEDHNCIDEEARKELRYRRKIQRRWMTILNFFFMAVIGVILILDKNSPPADTAMFMSFASMISMNMAYLFTEVWGELNITKTGVRL